MLRPEFLTVVEFNLGEWQIWKASEALNESFNWRFIVSECDFLETELRIVDEIEILANLKKTLAASACVVSIRWM